METEHVFDVFLSHAHIDAALVERLGAKLEDEAQLSVWLDKWVLVPGGHWQQDMAKGLDRAKICTVCIGAQTPQGWFREEIEKALNRQTRDSSFRVIPVILPGGKRDLVDSFLELRTWVDFKDGIEDGDAFHILLSGIRGVPPGRYRPPSPDVESTILGVRQALARIQALHSEQLIDHVIAHEYQRRLLDTIITPGGASNG